MGKHRKHKKRKQQPLVEDIPLVPVLTSEVDTAKAARELDDAWTNIDIYFSLLWDGKDLKKGEWWDFLGCLNIAKTAMQDATIHEYVKLKLLHRAKKVMAARAATTLPLTG